MKRFQGVRTKATFGPLDCANVAGRRTAAQPRAREK